MLDFAASWVELPPESSNDHRHQRYLNESLADWHERLGLTDEASE